MVSGNAQQPGASQVAEYLGKIMGLPSPEKILGELQRLNNNLELLQPDLNKLAKFLDGGGQSELKNLTAALNKVDLVNMMRVIQDFNHTSNQIYEKLWGKR